MHNEFINKVREWRKYLKLRAILVAGRCCWIGLEHISRYLEKQLENNKKMNGNRTAIVDTNPMLYRVVLYWSFSFRCYPRSISIYYAIRLFRASHPHTHTVFRYEIVQKCRRRVQTINNQIYYFRLHSQSQCLPVVRSLSLNDFYLLCNLPCVVCLLVYVVCVHCGDWWMQWQTGKVSASRRDSDSNSNKLQVKGFIDGFQIMFSPCLCLLGSMRWRQTLLLFKVKSTSPRMNA